MPRLIIALLVSSLALPAAAQSRVPSGRVSGRVVGAGTGVPISGVRVLLSDSPRETVTDHDGQFVLDAAFSLFAGRVGNMPGHPRMLSVLLTVNKRGRATRALP